MTTNEILFWALVILAWGLSLVVAYVHGQIKAFDAARKIADEIVRKRIEKLKQPPIR